MGGPESSDTVLIVEDQLVVRRSFERAIEKAYTVHGCGTYDDAVHALDAMNSPPTALILDVNLGGRRDGLDVVEYAYERFGIQIPTLVITGSTHIPEISAHAMRIRAEFLVKPQSPEVIKLFLERVSVRARWGASDVLDLDREVRRLAAEMSLTRSQTSLLFTLLRATEASERPEVNENTRKAGVRRILRRTGHATFDELRRELKKRAARRS